MLKDRSEKKAEARIALRDFVMSKGVTFDSLTPELRGKYLTRFYVWEVLRYLMPNMVPDDEEEIEHYVVDGAKDLGVDYIYRYDGTVLIVQSKYHNEKKTEDQGQLSHLAAVLKRIRPDSGLERNGKLEEALADVDWDYDNFQLVFVTLSKATDQLRAIEELGPSVDGFEGDMETRVDLRLVDESALNLEYREAISASQGTNSPVSLRLLADNSGARWLAYEGKDGKKAYVGKVDAAFLHELYKKDRLKLFWLNIRNYVGDTNTNKGIMDTSRQHPEWFFYFNNGISAVATNIVENLEKGTLDCDRFSIINGAQTVRSLYKAFAKDNLSVKKSEVMIRISEITLGGSDSDKKFVENITKYNNTQNSIRIADFRSNDPVQTQLKSYFDSISKGGKKFVYKNKREAHTGDRISVTLEEFAKTLHAFLFGPIDMFGGSSYLFDIAKDGGYSKIFGDKDETKSQDELQVLAGMWLICEKVREIFSETKEKLENREQELLREGISGVPAVKQALERRFLVYWVVGELLRLRYRQISEEKLKEHLSHFGKKPDLIEADKELGDNLTRIVQEACQAIVTIYRAQQKDSKFVHRNWFRSEKYLSELREHLVLGGTSDNIRPLRNERN